MGQPILVGHHSEGRHRAALKRSDNAMRRGCESEAMAERHEQVATTLERVLDRSIFSDDDNAIEAIEARIAERVAKRDRMKAINKEIRRGPGWELRMAPPLTDAEKAELSSLARCWGGVYKPGFPPYALSNLNGRIQADKKRIASIKYQNERREKAAASDTGVSIVGQDFVAVTFAEKPARSVLDALKAAGFHWSGGSWCGYRDKLPSGIA